MPGSVGAAAISGFAAALVIWIALLTHFQGFSTVREGSDTDVVAILFAFPPIAAAWAGIESRGALRGGVLLARASLAVSILVSSFAAWLFLVGSEPATDRAAHIEWGLVCSGASVNFAVVFAAWLIRSITQHRFTRRLRGV